METVEVLMSTLELKNEKEYIEIIKKAYKESRSRRNIFLCRKYKHKKGRKQKNKTQKNTIFRCNEIKNI